MAEELRSEASYRRDMGKIFQALEKQLQDLKIKRQPYHGACFVGNHVNIALKTENIEKICSVVVNVVEEHSPALRGEAMAVKKKFHELFTLFGSVHLYITAVLQ
ncbi:predicted protein [Nematostella vectensis]|nr:predicted protein [Nematostella vectensis]|eukprot:XP_001620653.1 hypothetical protein NEMVEDRAFT_v1g222865 [Nematostella vectensis]